MIRMVGAVVVAFIIAMGVYYCLDWYNRKVGGSPEEDFDGDQPGGGEKRDG